MKKPRIFPFTLILVLSVPLVLSVLSGPYGLYGQSTRTEDKALLEALIKEKEWRRLRFQFDDDSFALLRDYFAFCKSIKFTVSDEPGKLTYKAKLGDQGEVGVITYERRNGRFSNLKVHNQIRPLYFIESYRKYGVENLRVNIGGAVVQFKKGFFYEPAPFKFLLLFEGELEFSILPNNEEERITLKRKFKSETFSISRKHGIFILKDRGFMSRLVESGETAEPGDELKNLLHLYNEKYGIKVAQFDEYWYMPFSSESNMVLLHENKESLYTYLYNRDYLPDTQLVSTGTETFLLAYNHYKGLKLRFGAPGSVDKVRLNLFYNPSTNFLSGTATISYPVMSSLHTLQLAEGLELVSNLDLNSKGLNVFRKQGTYYLLGPETDSLSLYFKGHVERSYANEELFKLEGVNLDLAKMDDFFFLSRAQNFYPNPGDEFFESSVTLNIPPDLNSLVSGNLVEKRTADRKIFRFTGEHTGGISLVCGDFKQTGSLKSKIPVKIYSHGDFKYKSFVKLDEIKDAVNLFTEKLGPLRLPALHILLKRGPYEGGVSNTGFMVVNINPMRRVKNYGPDPALVRIQPKIISPILLRDDVGDYVLHELAHQWWGGVISARDYSDVWILEGLAQFTVLYFLEKRLSEGHFERIRKKLKRWILRFNDAGPVGYGSRIHQLEDSYEAYQGIVYNKGAFIFFMLRDMLGEKELFRRLRGVLEKYAFKNISSAQFVNRFCENDEGLKLFFKKWLHSRKLPRMVLDTQVNVNNDQEFLVRVRQLENESIFPLRVKVGTSGKTEYRTLVVERGEQEFVISAKHPIKWIRPVDSFTLVRID